MTPVDPLTGHELWADVYDTVPNPLLALEERQLLPWLGALEGLAVADVGCGTGRWMQRARDLGAKSVVGLDFSPNMLRQAARKPGLRGRLVLGDVTQIPVKSSSMDCVICAFVLGYVSTLDAAVSELSRIMKPKAPLFCSDFHPSAHQRGWKRVFKKDGRNVEIKSTLQQTTQIANAFEGRFRLEQQADLQLGEPERALFEEAGKLQFFDKAKGSPAVILFQWRRA
jgi:ubiquinone/menaquinone biosynthesis C-methylase UbiE